MKKKLQVVLSDESWAALEDRLNRISKSEGTDILRLRRQVAFARLLALSAGFLLCRCLRFYAFT